MNRDELIMAWDNAKTALANAKEVEAELRQQVNNELFSEALGKQKIDLGKGYSLERTQNVEHRISSQTRLADALDRLCQTFEDGEDVARRLVKKELKLSVRELNKLTADQRAIVDDAIASGPGRVVIELKKPKGAQ